MATLTKDTVENILQIVSDLRGESATNTDASRIRAVSRAERDFAKRRFWRTHLIKDQSIGTGDATTADFTLGSATYPFRMKGLMEVFVGGTTEDKRLEITDFATYKQLYNANNSAQICYEWFDVANDAWKVHLNRVPATGDAITGSWYFEPPKRTATTDSVICPNMDIIARLTLAYLYENEEELEKQQVQLQLAEQLIQEYEGIEEAPNQNQLYGVKTLINPLGNRGIGSY
jgi:hypothetical protein